MDMAETPIVIPFAKPRSHGASPQQFANRRQSVVTFRIGSSRFAIFASKRASVIPIQAAAERTASSAMEHACAVVSLASVPQQSDSCGAPSTGPQRKDSKHMQAAFFITADDKLGNTNHAEPPSGSVTFHSEQQLAQLAQDWPAGRLVRLWNGLAGVQRVQRFENRPWRFAACGEPSSPTRPSKAAPPASLRAIRLQHCRAKPAKRPASCS